MWGVACNLLLSYRALFLGLMAGAALMVLTMDQGGMAVVMSAHVFTYLFGMDDALLAATDTLGFRSSRLAARVSARFRDFAAAWAVGGGGGSAAAASGARSAAMRLAVAPVPGAGRESPSAWAAAPWAALFAFHVRETYISATNLSSSVCVCVCVCVFVISNLYFSHEPQRVRGYAGSDAAALLCGVGVQPDAVGGLWYILSAWI